jgi:hypothetical protein
MKPILHPDADAELTEAALYYESRQPSLGSDFLVEVERALDQILTTPEAFPKIGRRLRRKVLMAVPIQSDIRSLSGTNTNRSVRSPEEAAFLLAKASEGHTEKTGFSSLDPQQNLFHFNQFVAYFHGARFATTGQNAGDLSN